MQYLVFRQMKKVLVGIIVVLIALLLFRTCSDNEEQKTILKESSQLIQEQIQNVSKLIVTEGHFAEVYNYKDSQLIFGNFLTASKKALVVVNADVDVVYDLSKIEFKIDEENKVLEIVTIPEPEINIHPDFEYYDVTADYFNPFGADDYNKIKENVTVSLQEKIEASSLKANAKNRLISELSKFYILTNSLDWTLQYLEKPVQSLEELNVVDEVID